MIRLFPAFSLFLQLAALPALANDSPGNNQDASLDPVIAAKVDEVFAKMSEADKLAQLEGVRPNDLMENGKLSLAKCRKLIPNGIGHVCQFSCSLNLKPDQIRDLVRDFQHFLITETPAHIPASFQEELITGFPSVGSTTYPQHIGVGCAWNPELVQQCARATAETAHEVGCNLGLSPMVDVNRSPYWHRLEEGFGEDPYLTSRLALSFIQGLQGTNLETSVGATLKHFAAFGETPHSDQEFHEEFLMPFEVGIQRGNAICVMPCYADYKQVHAVGSKELLTDILRGQLQFKGLVVSDYGAVGGLPGTDSTLKAAQAINAGTDADLPGGQFYSHLTEAVSQGAVTQETIDAAVKRTLTLKARLGLLAPQPTIGQDGPLDLDPPVHRKLAYDAACQSLVLLKNNGVLPLGQNVKKIALVGPNSDSPYSLLGDYTYQTLAGFWFNIRLNPTSPQLVPLVDGLRSRIGTDVTLQQERGCDWSEQESKIDTNGDPRAKRMAESKNKIYQMVHEGLPAPDPAKALKIAAESDVIIAAVGEAMYLRGEARMRNNLLLPGNQEEFVQKLIATGRPVVLVVFGGTPMVLTNIEKKCAAIVYAWYPGEEGGTAVADLLLGKFNPSGKLCITLPQTDSQSPICYNTNYAGPLKPLYPFGYGLSYTTYEYRDLKISGAAKTSDKSIPVSFNVKNTGSMAGTEIVQLYVAPKGLPIPTKPISLKGFQRVELAPGEEKTVSFNISPQQLAVWQNQTWNIQPGSYDILVGSSSANLPLKATLELAGSLITLQHRTVFFSTMD
jgi:beta-glucosidase